MVFEGVGDLVHFCIKYCFHAWINLCVSFCHHLQGCQSNCRAGGQKLVKGICNDCDVIMPSEL